MNSPMIFNSETALKLLNGRLREIEQKRMALAIAVIDAMIFDRIQDSIAHGNDSCCITYSNYGHSNMLAISSEIIDIVCNILSSTEFGYKISHDSRATRLVISWV